MNEYGRLPWGWVVLTALLALMVWGAVDEENWREERTSRHCRLESERPHDGLPMLRGQTWQCDAGQVRERTVLIGEN